MGGLGGLIGLAITIGDIWAILNVIQSRESTAAKVVWSLLIVLMPLLGLVVWYFAGPRRANQW